MINENQRHDANNFTKKNDKFNNYDQKIKFEPFRILNEKSFDNEKKQQTAGNNEIKFPPIQILDTRVYKNHEKKNQKGTNWGLGKNKIKKNKLKIEFAGI